MTESTGRGIAQRGKAANKAQKLWDTDFTDSTDQTKYAYLKIRTMLTIQLFKNLVKKTRFCRSVEQRFSWFSVYFRGWRDPIKNRRNYSITFGTLKYPIA